MVDPPKMTLLIESSLSIALWRIQLHIINSTAVSLLGHHFQLVLCCLPTTFITVAINERL